MPETKNGLSRDVPLSTRAREILAQLDEGLVFELTPDQLSSLFRKAKGKAMIEGLTFHDSRREALTRLAKKFDVLELAQISGHQDLRILKEVYYSPTGEDLADKLD